MFNDEQMFELLMVISYFHERHSIEINGSTSLTKQRLKILANMRQRRFKGIYAFK